MTKKYIIDTLRWRYATKKFDTTKKISQDKIETILEAGNLTATSLGLQPFKIILIDDKEILASLKEITFNQENVQTCSHLLVLCAENDVDDNYIDKFITYLEKERNVEKGALAGYENMCKSFVNGLSVEQKTNWITHQAYIVLGNLLTVCADLEIDSCPMEGFNPTLLDKVLNLKQQNLRSVLMLPMGYRNDDDIFSNMPKVRKPLEDMVIRMVKS